MSFCPETPAAPLSEAIRCEMEGVFAEDFATVRVRPWRARPFGLLAWSEGETLYLPCSALGEVPEATPIARALIAHELAHVVQRRRARHGQPGAPAPALEAEASAAALSAVVGRSFRTKLSDTSGQPRAWGPAGHYYTSYLVMLAAGVPNLEARAMAFYAQMPDQLLSLDATQAGVTVATSSLPRGAAREGVGSFGVGDLLLKLVTGSSPITDALDVQRGLHALTGRSSADETRLRRIILDEAQFPSLTFGLAIHPYGDSFAHRMLANEGRMYPGPMGHAIEGKNAHAPDHLDKRPALYKEYALSLFDIVRGRVGRPLGYQVSREKLGQCLDEVAARSEEGSQIATVRSLAGAHMCQLLGYYAPENEKATSWDALKGTHNWLPADAEAQAMRLARMWSSRT